MVARIVEQTTTMKEIRKSLIHDYIFTLESNAYYSPTTRLSIDHQQEEVTQLVERTQAIASTMSEEL